MKFALRFTLLLAFLLTACLPGLEPAGGASPENAAAGQLQPAGLPDAPTPSAVPAAPPRQEISYRGFRLTCDESLASIVAGEAVQALIGKANRLDSPEHVRFTFDDLEPSPTFNPREPQMLIYPARAYRNISPQAVGQIDALQALIAGNAPLAGQPMPLLPRFAGEEALHARLRFLSFEGGSGVRYIAYYDDPAAALPAADIFYTFQGISADGAYYVAFFFPLEVTALAAPRPGDETAGMDFRLKDERQRQDAVARLNELDANDFSPNLDLLDALVESLRMPQPVAGLQQSQPPNAILELLHGQGLPALESLLASLDAPAQQLFDPAADLNAELFDLDANGSEDEYQVLVISDDARQNWLYLLFRSIGLRWWFSGSIALPAQEFVPPGYRIEGDGRDIWLVVDWLAQSGDEITRYEESWYLASRGPLKLVLSYPLEGFRVSKAAAYNVRYRASPEAGLQASAFSLTLPVSISYSVFGDGQEKTNPGETYDLFTTRRTAVFSWQPEEQLFQPDLQQSDMLPEQISAGFYFSGAGDELLQFARDELSLLARSGGSLQKRWLRRYLLELEAGPEKDELLRAIGG